MNPRLKIIVIGLVVIAAVAIGYGIFSTVGDQRQRLDQTELYAAVAEGQVEEVTITGDRIGYEIQGKLRSADGAPGGRSIRKFTSYVLKDEDLQKMLRESGVRVKAQKPQRDSLLSTLGLWIPMLLFVGIFIFFMRRMQQGGNQVLSFMRSRAKLSSQAIEPAAL